MSTGALTQPMVALPAITSSELTLQQFQEALPDQMKKNISKDVVDGINVLLSDPDMAAAYRDNLVGYTNVMKEGKFKLTSYVSAVKYVTQKLSGKNNQDAYMATFPDKWADWISRNVSAKDISSYVSVYNGSKLVNLILEQSLIPNWVLNQDVRQKAINHLATLMTTAQSEKVQADAAIGLLNALKMPDKLKVELDVGVKQDSVMDQLQKASLDLATRMQDMMKAGVWSAQDLLDEKVIQGEVERVD
jgi:hypothetical protein